jgi:uncharacterized protein YndB with AHSA1/START domain
MAARNASPSEPLEARQILIDRILDAPRERVWQAWTDPTQVIHWWGPRGFTTTIERMDVRPGGVWKYVMHGPDGTDYPNQCTFIEVVPPERLVFTHGGGARGQQSAQFESTWRFEALGGGTRIVIDMRFRSAADRDHVAQRYGAIEGARQTLQRLAEHLEAPSGGTAAR